MRILIDGVYLQLEPFDLSSLDVDQIKQTMLETKFYKLNEADRAFQPNESEEAATYFQRLTAKIIDNLELKLQNVHLRYEDNVTIPETVFSIGLTLDSFTIVTTDANWYHTSLHAFTLRFISPTLALQGGELRGAHSFQGPVQYPQARHSAQRWHVLEHQL